jgi:hypothetical protein
MRAGFPTGTRRCRSIKEAHSLDEESVLIVRDIASAKTLIYLLKHLLSFVFCKS